MARDIAWYQDRYLRCQACKVKKYETDADKLKSPVATPKIKAKRMGVFHIVEASYTLVAGFKARFRINISGVLSLE